MTIEVINPATGKLHKSYETLTQNELGQAIDHMEATRQDWLHVELKQRCKLMHNAAKVIRDDLDRYAMIITEEMGKPITQAKAEIEKCAWLCEHYADHAETYLQPELIQTEKSKSYRCFKPMGIVFAIMPWNFPFWQVMRFAVPNLLGGNAGLLKHAPNSTAAGQSVQEIFEKAGFPKGLFQSVIIDVELCGFIIDHHLVTGVTLTGSERAGSAVGAQAGKALKKVVLELGGSDPYVILEDADLDLAAQQCAISRLGNSGQVCIAAKRIIVVDAVREAFLEKLMAQIKTYQIGDPTDPKTNMGPMAREDLRTQLHDQVQRSIAAGVECVMGGELPEGDGYYYPPTVFLDVKKGTPAYDEELFGPVVCVLYAQDEDEALRIANDTPYGLGAAVFTQDVAKGEIIARDKLEAGTCSVNALVGSDPRLPFGGIKLSGHGRELAAEGMHEFMNIKTVVIK